MAEVIKNKITNRQVIARLLILAIFFSMFSYIVLVGKTVYTAVAREKTEMRADLLEKSVSILENEYMILRSEVTEALAKEKGFQNILSAKYISRHSLGQAFSMSNKQ